MISDLLPENLKGAVVELIPYFRGQYFFCGLFKNVNT